MSAEGALACCNFCASPVADGCTLKVCSKCHSVHYCNEVCQRKHWKNGHRDNCAPTFFKSNVEATDGGVPEHIFRPMSDAQRDAITVEFRRTSKAVRNAKNKDAAACWDAVECVVTLAVLYKLRNKWAVAIRFMDDFNRFIELYKQLVPEGGVEWIRVDASSHISCMGKNRRLVEAVLLSFKNASAVSGLACLAIGRERSERTYVLLEELVHEQTVWSTIDCTENIDRIIRIDITCLSLVAGMTTHEDAGAILQRNIQLSKERIQHALYLLRSSAVSQTYKSHARNLAFFLRQEELCTMQGELCNLLPAQQQNQPK